MLDKYIVLDIETTGLNKYRNKITEIAAIKVEKNKVIDKYEALVNPCTKIPKNIIDLTGINEDLVKNQKTIDQVLPSFLEFIKGYPIVGHNINFDYGFLDYNSFKYVSKKIDNPKICTLKLSRRILPKLKSKRLSNVCEFFEIENKQAHRAMSDVLATNKVFIKFQAILFNNGIKGNKIFEFEKF